MNVALSLTTTEAWIFLPLVIPICLWVMASDLKHMVIRNYAVLMLIAGFAVLGLFALPFEEYLWRFAHLAVIFVVGFALWSFAGIGFGAGDAKFAAASALFVVAGDWAIFVMILCATSILGVILHRVAKRVPVIVNATPEWVSWQEDKAFPWGVSLASALMLYLALGIGAGV